MCIVCIVYIVCIVCIVCIICIVCLVYLTRRPAISGLTHTRGCVIGFPGCVRLNIRICSSMSAVDLTHCHAYTIATTYISLITTATIGATVGCAGRALTCLTLISREAFTISLLEVGREVEREVESEVEREIESGGSGEGVSVWKLPWYRCIPSTYRLVIARSPVGTFSDSMRCVEGTSFIGPCQVVWT